MASISPAGKREVAMNQNKTQSAPSFSGAFPPGALDQGLSFVAAALVDMIMPRIMAGMEQALAAKQDEQTKAQLVSAEKACKLFDDPITKPTLLKWEREGHFNRYCIGSRVFYKVGEIIDAAKHLKRYKKEVSHV